MARVRKTTLSPRQRRAYELKFETDPPRTADEVAAIMDTTRDAALGLIRVAKAKVKMAREGVELAKPKEIHELGGHNAVEKTHPERAATFIDLRTDPQGGPTQAQAAELSQIPQGTAEELEKRLKNRYLDDKLQIERIKTDQLVRQFERVSYEAISSITPEELHKLNPKQRTIVAAIALDKRELLDGRPTERIGHDERKALPELVGLMIDEAKRRGLIKQVDPGTGRVSMVVDPGLREEAVEVEPV